MWFRAQSVATRASVGVPFQDSARAIRRSPIIVARRVNQRTFAVGPYVPWRTALTLSVG